MYSPIPGVPMDARGNVETATQDQFTKMLDLYFLQAIGITPLAVDAVAGEYEITVTDPTGFVDGSYVGVFSGAGVFYFGEQLGAPVGSAITLDTPLDSAFLTGSNVLNATRSLNVNGSVDVQVFQIGPFGVETSIEVDTTRIAGYLQDGTVMDDAKFGGLPRLTRGVVLRRNDHILGNYWNAKSNGDLALICASDFFYTDRSPAGSYGARFRNSFSGSEKHGVTVRLNPGDTLELLVQDDLTGLEAFTMMAQGHVVD